MTTPKAIFIVILALLAFSGASDPVLDIDGHPVVAGTDYYISPVIRGAGGGLTLAGDNASSCPLHVVQERFEVWRGLPVIFSPVNRTKVVPLSTDLNIEFSAATRCAQSTVWRLGGLDESKKQRFVTTGGVKGNPGRQTVSNWFKIDKDGDKEKQYKLVFCPSVCRFCKVVCGEVGVFLDGRVRRLALSDMPFSVRFKRA